MAVGILILILKEYFGCLFYSQTCIMTDSLEELENKCGPVFFRKKWEFLVNRNAIGDVSEYFLRKLKVNLALPFHKEIIVSREKKAVSQHGLIRKNEPFIVFYFYLQLLCKRYPVRIDVTSITIPYICRPITTT